MIVQQIVIRILHTNARDNDTLLTDQDTLRFSTFPFHNVEIISDYAYMIFIPLQFPQAIADRGRDSGVQSVHDRMLVNIIRKKNSFMVIDRNKRQSWD